MIKVIKSIQISVEQEEWVLKQKQENKDFSFSELIRGLLDNFIAEACEDRVKQELLKNEAENGAERGV